MVSEGRELAARIRRTVAVSIAACGGLGLALMSLALTTAHGNLDQYLAGDPGCNATNFPQSAPLDSSIRQEFVPSGTRLSSIGVCLQSTAASGTIVSIAVREGSASSAGTLVGALNVTAPAGSTTYVHADFPAALNVTSGGSYVIEVAPASGQIVWRGAPDGVDWYPAGESSTAITDLAFRSYIVPVTPTATNTSTNTPPAATSTIGPGTNTPTRTPTRTPTVTSTSTIAAGATATPFTPAPPPATPTLPTITDPDPGATSTPRPAGVSVTPSSNTPASGTTAGATTTTIATPRASRTPSGVVLAGSTPQRSDVVRVSEEASDGGGGPSWAVVMLAVAGALVLAAGGGYGVWRWKMRE